MDTIPRARARLARAAQLGRHDEARRLRRDLSRLVVRQFVLDHLDELDGAARAELRALLAPLDEARDGQ